MENNKNIHPEYYRNPDGIQIIELIRHLPFCLGNAVKYIYRCRTKENKAQDLDKALWYIKDHKNNSTQLTLEYVFGYSAFDGEMLNTLLKNSDDFEQEAIREICHQWLSSGDFEKAAKLVDQELKRFHG